MIESDPLAFWYEHIGEKLGAPDAKSALSVFLPQRSKDTTKSMRIGTGRPTFFMAAKDNSEIVGGIDLPDQPDIKFVAAENVNARTYVAQWLLTAQPPYIVGVIGKANIASSLSITHSERLGIFCEANNCFQFDMAAIRQAQALFADFPWSTVAVTLHEYARYQANATPASREKLKKAFAKLPGLREALAAARIKPGSGEYEILSWLNR